MALESNIQFPEAKVAALFGLGQSKRRAAWRGWR